MHFCPSTPPIYYRGLHPRDPAGDSDKLHRSGWSRGGRGRSEFLARIPNTNDIYVFEQLGFHPSHRTSKDEEVMGSAQLSAPKGLWGARRAPQAESARALEAVLSECLLSHLEVGMHGNVRAGDFLADGDVALCAEHHAVA